MYNLWEFLFKKFSKDFVVLVFEKFFVMVYREKFIISCLVKWNVFYCIEFVKINYRILLYKEEFVN